MLSKMFQRMWWVLLLRGVIGVLFGIAVLAMPGIALASLILVFGAFLIVEGAFTAVQAIAGRRGTPHWGLVLVEGLIALALGVLVLRAPGLASLTLLYFIATWAVVSGLMRFVLAIALRKEIKGEFWLALSGGASVLFGLIMFARPGAGALALLWLIGLWSIFTGIAMVILAFRARRFGKTLSSVQGMEAAGI
jgi:uncharacterized membrane protein HdeD (DUF308 family)